MGSAEKTVRAAEGKREKAKKLPSGSESKGKNPTRVHNDDFKYFDLMKFLDDTIEPMPSTNSLQESPTSAQSTINHVRKVTGADNYPNKKRCSGSCSKCDDNDEEFGEKLIAACFGSNPNKSASESACFLGMVDQLINEIPKDTKLSVQMEVLKFIEGKL
ncbi:hypothetical protein QAD02_002837 [Eretmocerus hayati]|uniref:Uncharacterized protein n=1 Tax=Eretmocerus hayati TaxID=131215 RepID=A0ACC2NL05_9HYME|nr:hypothetical protein QAD02_002837 [Eretmocerus hayati]